MNREKIVKIVDGILENDINFSSRFTILDSFSQAYYYALELGAKEGFLTATSNALTLNIDITDELFEIGFDIVELFETIINFDYSSLQHNALIDFCKQILLAHAERGFFFGYILSNKSIKKFKDNITIFKTGTN